jgi:hypothetical protein
MTCVVTVLLAVLSMAFSRDAYNIMIRPIEKMKHTVQQLSENPLLHLKKLEEQGSGPAGESETDMLEHAITKMARLLQIGFGSAGAEIIANNLSEGGELNPMVPGSKVEAIFGFCDIRDFTFATEGLQQDVMLFVNKIADITHRCVPSHPVRSHAKAAPTNSSLPLLSAATSWRAAARPTRTLATRFCSCGSSTAGLRTPPGEGATFRRSCTTRAS